MASAVSQSYKRPIRRQYGSKAVIVDSHQFNFVSERLSPDITGRATVLNERAY